ncbi:MAG: STAS/SEC14 domain-containing protein [Pseudomonadota bacterium]
MSIQWEEEAPGRIVARVNGELAQSETAEFQAAVAPLLQAAGKTSFLVILEQFQGWAAGKGWEDTSFADANDQYLSRFAIVGDEQWRDKALMFSLAGLRPVEIQYFSAGEEAEARQWLAWG